MLRSAVHLFNHTDHTGLDMRTAAAAVLAAACLLAAATAATASRRPQAYPHLQSDWDELRQHCEAKSTGCEKGAPHENCVRR